jgi:putative transposase
MRACALRELAAVRPRFGCRRLLVLMHREGLVMNHEKFSAIDGTTAGEPTGQTQASARHPGADDDTAAAEPALEPQLPVGRLRRRPRFRIFPVVGDFTRECRHVDAGTAVRETLVALPHDWMNRRLPSREPTINLFPWSRRWRDVSLWFIEI